MNSKVIFHNTELWHSMDQYRTTNFFNISINNNEDQYGFKPAYFHIKIVNYKNRVNNYMSFQYKHLNLLLETYTKFYNQFEHIGIDWKEKLEPIIINKKKFMVFFLKTAEYGETVLIIMSNRGKDYLDSEKFFMPFYDFNCLCKLLKNSLNEYHTIATNHKIVSLLSKIENSIDNNNDKLTQLQRTIIINSGQTNIDLKESISESSSVNLDEIFNKSSDLKENNLEEEKEKNNSIVEDKDDINDSTSEVNTQFELDDFIQKTSSTMEVLDKNKLQEKNKYEEEVGKDNLDHMNDNFTELVLNNDVINFEILIKSCLSKRIPLLSLINIIKEKMDIDDIFPGISKEEYLSILYCNTIYLKEIVRRHIQEKNILPPSVYPVRCNINDYPKENCMLMFSMYSYMICYSSIHLQLKEKSDNTFENKGFYSFVLKVITSPFVYSFLDLYTKENFVNTVMNVIKIQLERKVFDNLFKTIENKFAYTPVLNLESLNDIAGKTYDIIKDKWKCIDNDQFMKKLSSNKISILDWRKFIECGFDNEDQISKFIMLEFQYKLQNGNIDINKLSDDIKDTSDLSKDALSYLNLHEIKYDNTNLLRICDSFLKEDDNKKYIKNVLNNININLNDIECENINWNLFPNEVLNAILLWTPSNDSSIMTNFKYFKDKYNECYIDDRTILISSMKKNNEKIDNWNDPINLEIRKEQI